MGRDDEKPVQTGWGILRRRERKQGLFQGISRTTGKIGVALPHMQKMAGWPGGREGPSQVWLGQVRFGGLDLDVNG